MVLLLHKVFAEADFESLLCYVARDSWFSLTIYSEHVLRIQPLPNLAALSGHAIFTRVRNPVYIPR